jgi:hypothetical protein
LGLELAREVPMEIEDIDRELAEAGGLRDYWEEDVKVTLEELMGEVDETSKKMDANLFQLAVSPVQWIDQVICRRGC